MSLTDPQDQQPQDPQPQETSKPELQTSKKQGKPTREKLQRALKIAEQYKDKSWTSAYPEMKKTAEANGGEKISRTTLWRAFQEVTKEKRAKFQKDGAQKPHLKIEKEQPKTPSLMTNDSAIEELPSAPAPTETAAGTEGMDTEYIRDMLRGVHASFLSKEGILGEKYGRKLEQCNTVSDQLCRYITKRVTPEQLEQYDTALLAASYLSLVAGILNEVRKDRMKKAEKEQKP